MEIDILGQGMPEEGNKDDGLDLEESVWTDNDAYKEFRKMVLDDYRERKRVRDEEIELLKAKFEDLTVYTSLGSEFSNELQGVELIRGKSKSE